MIDDESIMILLENSET